jgi:hypothetical protein
MSLQREGGEVVLVLRDELDRLKPIGQRQLGGMKQGAGTQRALGAVLSALPVPVTVGEEARMLPGAARWTDDPSGQRARYSACSHWASVPY